MSKATPSDPWNAFWERQKSIETATAAATESGPESGPGTGGASSGASGGGSGCLPKGWSGIANRQRTIWHSFARKLPKDAKVLDLATGDGAVLAHLKEARRDLVLTGIDRAGQLPAAPRGTTIQGEVDMAALPFPDSAFTAVTSQFGFEYGDIAKIAREIARVLIGGGHVSMLTHRIDGPIVTHNRNRRDQIAWAIEEQGLIGLARDSLALRKTGNAGIPEAISKAPAEGAKHHGPRSAAWEIAEAIRQTLDFGKNDTPENVSTVLDEIDAQARNELGRIASLEAAATQASDPEAIFCAMEQAGFRENSVAMVSDGQYPRPFADFRTYTLSA